MTIALVAPLTGWLGPLDEVPDAAFAERLVGDGVAIDPIGTTLHAPCAATVIAVAATRHAVTLRTAAGAELLLHVGINTVALAGNGFTAHVTVGDAIAAGEVLLSFDLDLLATRATSLLTPVVVINSDAFAFVPRRAPGPVAVGDVMAELRPLAARAAKISGPSASLAGDDPHDAGPSVTATAVIAAEHGIHARPAAAIAKAARGFAAALYVAAGEHRADARSSVALMTLGLANGALVEVGATGPDAAAAVAALVALLQRAEPAASTPAGTSASTSDAAASLMPVAAPADLSGDGLRGVPAAPGLAIGVAVPLVVEPVRVTGAGAGIATERELFLAALGQVRGRLVADAAGEGAPAAIAAAHLDLLNDASFADAAVTALTEGLSAAAAWHRALDPAIAALAGLDDPRLAARADDLRDLRAQVAAAASGGGHAPPDLPDHAIIVAADLLPSQLMALATDRLAGIVLAGGGPTAHVAIIAAARSVPMVVAAGPGVLDIAAGTPLIVDANAGRVTIDPDAAALTDARAHVARKVAARIAVHAAASSDCRTADGRRIEVFANLGSVADAEAAVAAGAEGCGLLRTELLFLDRAAPPGVDEQARHYQAVADALRGRPMILRTLDIGGDKPAPYLALPVEANPALGLRGIRVGLAHPDLLRDQLRAAMMVRPLPRLLLPMIASVAELIEVRQHVDGLAAELGTGPVAFGVMIETPAAAVTADRLAAHADFFAIGTNDLSQYALAMDRGNPAVAAGIDALHPAVLRLVAQACAGAAAHRRPVGICGSLASDLTATAILIGLGVTELSAVPTMVAEVKARVRTLHEAGCTMVAHAALTLDSAAAVRALAASQQ